MQSIESKSPLGFGLEIKYIVEKEEEGCGVWEEC
jgi:hypothetical protein